MQRCKAKRGGQNGSKYPGICADAKALGIHRNTMLRLRKGQRVSPKLAARYAALKSAQATAKT